MDKKIYLKGISLIVLVITIIVMIILAGAIILSLSNGNVIARAKLAKESNDFTGIREMVEMENGNAMFEGASFSTANTPIPSVYESDIEIKVGSANKATILLKYNANTKITDIGNAIDKLGAVYIPQGFTVSTIAGEQTIEDGVVIKNTADSNEFVWVPVPNITEFIRLDVSTWATIGWLYKGYETLPLVNQPAEYKEMRASVIKYKGFYIARYEAGVATNMTQSAPSGDTTAYGTGAYKPVSKPNTFIWTGIKWSPAVPYGAGEGVGYAGDPTLNGAVKASRAIYPLASATTEGFPVSTLIYAEQWGAAMRYMKDVPNTLDSTKKYITDSTGMGNYTGTIAKSAASSAYKVKNIYDMAGNVREWTMESVGDWHRALQGGVYHLNGADYPASCRSSMEPEGYDIVGFRTAIYIKEK